MAVEIQVRRDTAADWVSANPTLAQGEWGLETDTTNLKMGNGASVWTQLPYQVAPASVASIAYVQAASVNAVSVSELYAQNITNAFNPRNYGAVGNTITGLDGAMADSVTTFTSTYGYFTNADVGKTIAVQGAGSGGVDFDDNPILEPLFTSIVSVQQNGIKAFGSTPILSSLTSGNTLTGFTTPTFGYPGTLTQTNGSGAGSSYSPSGEMAYWNAGTFGPNCETYVTLNQLTSGNTHNGYLWARVTNPGTSSAASISGYQLEVTTNPNQGTWYLNSVVAGSVTTIGTAYQVPSAGDSIGLRCVNSTISVWYKPANGSWSSILSVTDSSVTGSGYIGMGILNYTAIYLSNFGGGTLTSSSITLANAAAASVSNAGFGYWTDDTAAIQRCINAASSVATQYTPATILFPAGIYGVSPNLTTGTVLSLGSHLNIVGVPGAIIYAPFNPNADSSFDGGVTEVFVFSANASYWKIQGMTFDGGNRSNATQFQHEAIITGTNSTYWGIEDCEFYGFCQSAMFIAGDGAGHVPNHFRVQNLDIHHFGGGQAFTIANGASDFLIDNIQIHDSYSPGAQESIILSAGSVQLGTLSNIISVNWGDLNFNCNLQYVNILDSYWDGGCVAGDGGLGWSDVLFSRNTFVIESPGWNQSAAPALKAADIYGAATRVTFDTNTFNTTANGQPGLYWWMNASVATETIIANNTMVGGGLACAVNNDILIEGNMLEGNCQLQGGGNSRWRVLNNWVASGHWMTVGANDSIVSGNTILGYTSGTATPLPLTVGGSRTVVNGNRVSNAQSNGAPPLTISGGSYMLVSNNVLYNGTASGQAFNESSGASVNTFVNNTCTVVSGSPSGGASGTGSVMRGNTGLNPLGLTTVSVPSSGTAIAAATYDRTFTITGGALGVVIAVGGSTVATIPGNGVTSVFVPAGATMTPTYTNAPTWTCYGN